MLSCLIRLTRMNLSVCTTGEDKHAKIKATYGHSAGCHQCWHRVPHSQKPWSIALKAHPEGFDPAPFTAGTTFNASSKPLYNRLVEFKRGTSEVIPGLAESWAVSSDGLEYTFKLRKGVKFQTTEFFTPSRDFNADDVVFSFERQLKKDHPWNQYTAGICLGIF